MKFLLLTLFTTGDSVMVRSDSIVFAAPDGDGEKIYTRIFLKQVQMHDDELPYIDVKESVKDIYKKLMKE